MSPVTFHRWLQITVIVSVISGKCCLVEVLWGRRRLDPGTFSHHTAGSSELTPRYGSCRAGPRTPRAPANVTETRKTVSGYYGRLLWQPQVSVRASISHSVGERGRETEGWREEPAERRRVEKSAEEVRCGNKHAFRCRGGGAGGGCGGETRGVWKRQSDGEV